jgi:hypothetical protein
MDFTHCKLSAAPDYCPQIPILSDLCPQLNLLNQPKKFLGMPLDGNKVWTGNMLRDRECEHCTEYGQCTGCEQCTDCEQYTDCDQCRECKKCTEYSHSTSAQFPFVTNVMNTLKLY